MLPSYYRKLWLTHFVDPHNKGDSKRSPRCLDLLQSLKSRCKGQALVEVVFRGQVRLPDNTEYKNARGGWRKLFI